MAIKIANRNDPAFLEQQRQAWQKMRRQGKASFVLRRGLLVWGGMMFLIFAGLNAFVLNMTGHLDHLPGLLWFNAVIMVTWRLVLGTLDLEEVRKAVFHSNPGDIFHFGSQD